MGKQLYKDLHAEQEANEAAARFMDSTDVIGDMSRAYGHDFSDVHIHTDESAAQRVEGTGVDALASGKDIFFGRNVFQQNDPTSRGLLAHELTHTMQQSPQSGMEQSAPEGAQQGGLIDWFRKRFRSKKRPNEEAISGPLSVSLNDSEDSVRYMTAMQNAVMPNASQIANRVPTAKPGQIGDAAALTGLQDIFANGNAIHTSNEFVRQGDRNNALAAIGIRTSQSAEAKADKAYRGDLLGNYSSDVADYFYNLQQGGLNMKYILPATTKGNLKGSPGAYVTGGRIDQMEQDLLSLFGNYATSDQSLEYIKNVSSAIGDADVFENDPRAVINYVIQCMLTSTGASHTKIMQQGSRFQDNENTVNTAREVLRTLLYLPNLASKSAEVRSTLPPEVNTLVDQYNALLDQIQQKLAAAA